MQEDTLEVTLVPKRIPITSQTEESCIHRQSDAACIVVLHHSLDSDGCIHAIGIPDKPGWGVNEGYHYAHWDRFTGEWTVKHMSAEKLLGTDECVLHIMALSDPDELKLVTCKHGEDICWVRHFDQHSLTVGPVVEIPFGCGHENLSCGPILLLPGDDKTGIYNVRTGRLIEVERNLCNLYSDIEHFFVTTERIYALTKKWSRYVVDILEFSTPDSWDYTAMVPLLVQDEYYDGEDNLLCYDSRIVMFAEIEGCLNMLLFEQGRILSRFTYDFDEEGWRLNPIQQEGVVN